MSKLIKKANATVGERTSFVELVEGSSVVVPKIQRDYAQGRNNDRVGEIRTNFIDALLGYLSDGKYCHDLDFIYGSTPTGLTYLGDFIPLDGQQRLTTLFLLHWYLAAVNGKQEDFKSLMIQQSEKGETCRFTYQTRESSSLFCEGLVGCELMPKMDGNLSVLIRKTYWFFSSWNQDTSVSGMLRMLDTIDRKMAFHKNEIALFYERLFGTATDNSGKRLFAITFQKLDIGDFHLTDDLYIKMNSRGVPLTGFEIFKSKIEQMINQKDFFPEGSDKSFEVVESGKKQIKKLSLPKYFSYQMDRSWADLFWDYTEENTENGTRIFDKQMMRFIRFILLSRYAENNIFPSGKGLGVKKYVTEYDPLEVLRNTKISEKWFSSTTLENLSFYIYRDCGVLTQDAMNYLIDAFDAIVTYRPDNNLFKVPEVFWQVSDTWNDLMHRPSLRDLGHVDLVRLYAYIAYLVQAYKSGVNLYETACCEDVRHWMRFIYAVSVNATTRIDSAELVAKMFWSINRLLDGCKGNVYERISKLSDMDISGLSFNEFQMKEERLKAQLVLNGKSEWDKRFDIWNRYLDGQIGFLLDWSGIYKAFVPEDLSFKKDWDEENSFLSFVDLQNRTFNLFDALSDDLAKKDADRDYVDTFVQEALIERSLLALDDYLPSPKHIDGKTLSNKPRSRDFSWRRALSMDSDYEPSRAVFETLLSAGRFQTKEAVIKDLNTIIDSYVNGSPDYDWRTAFIMCPAACRYGDNSIVMFEGFEGICNGIYLIGRSRWNSTHVELFSYHLFNHLKEKFRTYRMGYNAVSSRADNRNIYYWVRTSPLEEVSAYYAIRFDYSTNNWIVDHYPEDDSNVPDAEPVRLESIEAIEEYLINNCSYTTSPSSE